MPLTARAAYRQTSLETAPKHRVLVQLYERLERDLQTADAAITTRDYEAVHEHLVHAQSIVAALSSALDVSVWADGENLRKIYDFLSRELPLANLEKSSRRINGCLRIVGDITEAWRGAVLAAGAQITLTDRA